MDSRHFFFASKYPGAKIIAIEPEESNFELLRKNVVAFPNVVCLQQALWRDDEDLQLADPGSGHWGFQTRAFDDDEIPVGIQNVSGITMETLLAEEGLDHVDLLKVDIEGSEKEVLEHSASWIGKIGVVMVEIHEKRKSGCEKSFRDATQEFATVWSSGEYTCAAKSGTVSLPHEPG